MSLLNRIARVATTLVREVVRSSGSRDGGRPRRGGSAGRSNETWTGADEPARTTVPYQGDLPQLTYQPQPDDDADPGEVVWAWVPYDEGDGQGKDRPVLVLARHRGGFLGLQMTSKDHDRDRDEEARWGRYWIDVGSGAWDSRGRESEVRLDRVLFLPADAVRREGAELVRERYDEVVAALHALRQRTQG